MKRLYPILRNMCYVFAADLLALAAFMLGGLLDSAVLFAGGLYGGILISFLGTSIAVGLGLMRPLARDAKTNPVVAILGAIASFFVILGLVQSYFVVFRAYMCSYQRECILGR